MAQGTPPADGTTPPPAEATPPPAETSPPVGRRARHHRQRPPAFRARDRAQRPLRLGRPRLGRHGAGARYMIPVPITQLLTRTRFRDYWAVEFGADIVRINYDYGFGTTAYSYNWTEVVPVAGMMWQVWFNENFAAYPKVELGYAFGWYSDTQGGTTTGLSGGNHFYPAGSAGSSTRWAAASPSAPRPATSAPRAASPGCSRVDPPAAAHVARTGSRRAAPPR